MARRATVDGPLVDEPLTKAPRFVRSASISGRTSPFVRSRSRQRVALAALNPTRTDTTCLCQSPGSHACEDPRTAHCPSMPASITTTALESIFDDLGIRQIQSNSSMI